MTQLLTYKGSATRFQILIQIAAEQPDIRLRSIAANLDVSVQAVFNHIHDMISDGLLLSEGRSKYHLTNNGLLWLTATIREMQAYIGRIERITRNLSVSPAVAACNLRAGQTVGMFMESGVLKAKHYSGQRARGIAATSARTGLDVGIAAIEGIVEIEKTSVFILEIPGIRHGGSRKVDQDLLFKKAENAELLGAIGTEAVISLRAIGIPPHFLQGVKDVAVSAVHRGLCMTIACVSNQVPILACHLDQHDIRYNISDVSLRN